MKKLFWVLLPMLAVIAILFTYQGRTFSSEVLLDVISQWRFDNGLELLGLIKDTFAEVGRLWETVDTGNFLGNILNGIIYIGKSIYIIMRGMIEINFAMIAFIKDLFNNVTSVTNYLLGV